LPLSGIETSFLDSPVRSLVNIETGGFPSSNTGIKIWGRNKKTKYFNSGLHNSVLG